MVMDALVVVPCASSFKRCHQDCALMHWVYHQCCEVDSWQECAVMDILTMYAERPDLKM